MDPTTALILLPGLVIGITVHEFAHAWSASLLGDKFARRQGRVSLNPLRHLSPLGTLAIFVLPIGWGKPVPVNLYNFKRPKRDYLITSLAGPFANILVMIVCIGLMHITRHCYWFGDLGGAIVRFAHSVLALVAFINLMLATINLIPIPPLDGSKIWPCVIPNLKPSFGRKTTWIFLVIIMALVWTGTLNPLIDFTMNKAQSIMPVSDSEIFEDRYDAALNAFVAKEFAQAEQLFTEALAINPRAGDCFYWRACARGWQDKWHGALDDMDQALELVQSDPEYYEFRATVLEHLGRSDDAEKDHAAARKLRKDSTPTSKPATSRPTDSNPSALPAR